MEPNWFLALYSFVMFGCSAVIGYCAWDTGRMAKEMERKNRERVEKRL
jgi:hypothetical protein